MFGLFTFVVVLCVLVLVFVWVLLCLLVAVLFRFTGICLFLVLYDLRLVDLLSGLVRDGCLVVGI